MRWLANILLLLQLSCTVDELPSCNGNGFEGEICKEYQYTFGRYKGVNEYEYDLNIGLVSKITTKRKNGSIEGYTSYLYNDLGQISSITLKDSKNDLISEKRIQYNNWGAVESQIITGQKKSEHYYFYNENLLCKEVFLSNGEIEWTDSIEYLAESNEIYRKIRYVENSISQITYYETFSNNILKQKTTNSNGVIQGTKVTLYNHNQKKIEELTYSKENHLVNTVRYYYFDGRLDRIEKFNHSGLEYEELNYQRF
tara:strand:- start:1627 stop:2391 length:765 start_codon:yes stop_codon:yes gene_type:complete